MDQSTYLNLSEVKNFIEWLSALLNSDSPESFVHSYAIEPRGKSKSSEQWRCTSIFHAFKQYEWRFSFKDYDSKEIIKGSSYSESETALNDLQEKLIKAVDQRDNDACFKACAMILKWGGVLGSPQWGNEKRLLEMIEYLADYLQEARKYFNNKSELLPSHQKYQFALGRGPTNIIMNAGFTKIYSLLCKNFIIYDGRVGSALGRLVVEFLNSEYGEKYRQVPDSLKFYYGKAKNAKVNRNPSVGNYDFKALNSSSSIHIKNNLKANWIVEALDLEKVKDFSEQVAPSRAFEAALFMIGYRM